MREAQLFVAPTCSERSGFRLTNSFKLRFIAEGASCKRSHICPRLVHVQRSEQQNPCFKPSLSALTVAETCSQPLNGCKILPLVTHTLHGVAMQRSHAPTRREKRGHPRGFQGFRLTAEKSER
jgi:hypothetical protein